MRSQEISEKIAKKVAEMHSIQVSEWSASNTKLGSYDKMDYFNRYYNWIEGIKNNSRCC